MPEFERNKRKHISDQQLFDEYYGTDKKKSVKNSSKGKKNATAQGKSRKKNKSAKKESVSISPERQRVKEKYPKANAVRTDKAYSSKKKKASASKKGNPPKKGEKNNVNNKKKKKRRGNYILYYLLCGIAAIAVVAFLSTTVLFNIKRYEVIGDTQYSDEEIIDASGIKLGENLLRIDIDKAEENIISKLVQINDAKIERGFPDKLIITARPAVPLANFYISGKYYLISETGKVLEISDEHFELPLIKGYTLDPEKENNPETKISEGKMLEDDSEKKVTAALSIIEHMRQCGLDKDITIDLTDILSIKVIYDNRIEMQLGTTAATDEKIFNASLLILDHNEIAEKEKCVLILTNPYHVTKQPIRENEAQTDGYVLTTDALTDSDPEDDQADNREENSAENE